MNKIIITKLISALFMLTVIEYINIYIHNSSIFILLPLLACIFASLYFFRESIEINKKSKTEDINIECQLYDYITLILAIISFISITILTILMVI
jgi:hypothetical protein